MFTETEKLGKTISESLELDKPVYDESLGSYLEPESDYELLNQDTGVVFIEYENSSTQIFAYIDRGETFDPKELPQSEQDMLIEYLSSKGYEDPVDFGINTYHQQELEQNL